ncbi:MAG: nucleotidyltransferase family protein [Pseudomonadota bacterium]
MIFAAGLGTRMAPLTEARPKPLIEVAGQTLLHHALRPAQAAGLAPIVVNAHYKAAQIEAALAPEPVTVLLEDTLLDTGGGLKNALPALGPGPVFTMNSDAVWDGPNPFEVLREGWRDGLEALLLCVPVARARGREDIGDFAMDTAGRLRRGPGVVYTGAQIIDGAVVAAEPGDVFSFNPLWDAMIARDTLRAALYPGHWCDVGRPASIALAEEMVGA